MKNRINILDLFTFKHLEEKGVVKNTVGKSPPNVVMDNV